MTTTTERVAEISDVKFREQGTRSGVRIVTIIFLTDGTSLETRPGGKVYVSPTMTGKAWKLFEREGFLVDIESV
jgi:hypothetical protein